jgi:hypothetical protein
MTLETLTIMTRYPADFYFYRAEDMEEKEIKEHTNGNEPVGSGNNGWFAASIFAGRGSRVISHGGVIKNEGECEDCMSGCSVKWNNNEKIYQPKGEPPKCVWSEEKCFEHFKKRLLEGVSLKDILLKSAEWLGEAPQGWESNYRSDCIRALHKCYDDRKVELEGIAITATSHPEMIQPKKVKLFGAKKNA